MDICGIFVICLVAIGAIFLILLSLLLFPFFWLFGAKRAHYVLINYLADYYWVFMMWMVEIAGGTRFAFYGDQVPMRETALVIANHQSYSDWLSIFALSMRKGRMGTQKFFAKDVIRYIPGFGWGIWLLGSVFLSRNWQKDMKIIHDMFAHLNYLNCGFWLTLFAEGTRLTPEKLAESQAFAKKNDRTPLNHCLMPRTKGFVATVKGLQYTLDSVYDFTIGYESEQPPAIWDLMSFINRGPTVHVFVKRYSLEELPTDDNELSNWCFTLFEEKDKRLQYFMKNGKFEGTGTHLKFAHASLKL